jgi:hypothetical protein
MQDGWNRLRNVSTVTDPIHISLKALPLQITPYIVVNAKFEI